MVPEQIIEIVKQKPEKLEVQFGRVTFVVHGGRINKTDDQLTGGRHV